MSKDPKAIHFPSRVLYADLRGTSGFDMSGFKYIHEKPPNPIISLPPGPDVPIPTSSLRLDINLDLVDDEWDDSLRGRLKAEVRADMIRERDQIAMGPATGWYRPASERVDPPLDGPRWPPFEDEG